MGCRKEAANEKPHISILSPAGDASVSIPDTLLVTVAATDDIGLERVAIGLLDQNYIPVIPGTSVPASGTSATVTLALPITSEQLASGVYKLMATASDGSLVGRDWHDLHITAAPLRLQAVFTVTEPAPGTLSLFRTDSTGQTTVAGSWPMDFAGAAVSSSAQRVFVAGSVTGNLKALAPDGQSLVWDRPNLAPPGFPWFTSVDLCDNGYLYVGHADGTIRGFRPGDGSGGSGATMPETFHCLQSTTMGDLLLTTERHFVTGEHRVGIYYWRSGTMAATQPLDLEPVGLFPRDAGHALIFGNRNGVGRVLDRTLNGGGNWEAYTWQAPITAVERVSGLTWLVALANGDLQRFTYGGTGSLSIGSGPVLGTMAMDPLNGWVYGGTEGQVVLIDPLNGTFTDGWAVNGTVRKVLPLLNR